MRIVVDHPPIWDEAAERFGLRPDAQVIFSWGDLIYNPNSIVVTPSLLAHEEVHGARQGTDVVGWWRRYLDEAEFRLAEEVPAHQVEYRVAMEHARNRHERRSLRRAIAARLASPLYGHLVTRAMANRLITQSLPSAPEDGTRGG